LSMASINTGILSYSWQVLSFPIWTFNVLKRQDSCYFSFQNGHHSLWPFSEQNMKSAR
jgi:hypothetical protein